MSEEEGKSRGISGDQPPQHHYGTFQGVANYYPPAPFPPPQPVVGFPQPVPPSGASPYSYGYQTAPVVVQVYSVAEGRPVRERHLPCCGIGVGWALLISGFFLGAIPWYIGAFILLCVRVDYREKAGYVACTIAATLVVITVILGVTDGTHAWLGLYGLHK